METAVITKECTKCKNYKSLLEYKKQRGCRFGVRSICKSCDSTYRKNHRIENVGKYKERDKKYYEKNKDKFKSYAKSNALAISERMKSWRRVNATRVKSNKQRWDAANRNHVRIYNKQKLPHTLALQRRRYSQLTDTVVKSALKRQKFPVTSNTIELKRNIIIIKRIDRNYGKSKEKIHRTA